jgi:hypothetical protein
MLAVVFRSTIMFGEESTLASRESARRLAAMLKLL